MEFTDQELACLDLALTNLRRQYAQLARDFRREPASEEMAQSYDEQVALAAALLARLRAEGR